MSSVRTLPENVHPSSADDASVMLSQSKGLYLEFTMGFLSTLEQTMTTLTRFHARASFLSLALLGASAFAQVMPEAGLTRAEVVSATLAARANGTLMPAGDGASVRMNTQSAPSQVSRASVASDVRSARAAGELLPTGEAAQFAVAQPTSSIYSRAEIKASVIAARRAGELVPAGEGPDASVMAVAKQAAAYRAARDDSRAERLAKR